jgi:hypothetical protein
LVVLVEEERKKKLLASEQNFRDGICLRRAGRGDEDLFDPSFGVLLLS